MNNKVLIIAGGKWQVPIITYLKNKGFETFVVDPYDYSDGVIAGDQHIKADVRDVDEIWKQVQSVALDFITTDQSDISVETVAVLNERLQLPGNKISVVKLFADKSKSREFARQLKIPVPAFNKVYSVNDIGEFCKEFGYPVILKPVDSQSSRGIVKIDAKLDSDKLREALSNALATSKKDYALIESFVEGVEITIEGVASDFLHKSLATSSKKHFRTGIASSLEYPSSIPESLLNRIIAANDKYVEASGLQFGITHAEYIVNVSTEKFWLVEIACRGGGSLISSHITNWVSGTDVYEILFQNLIGGTIDVKAIKPMRRNAILHFFEFPAGKVRSVSGLEEARKISGVLVLELFFEAESTIDLASDDRSRQGYVILFAESKDELDRKLNQVINEISIHYYESSIGIN